MHDIINILYNKMSFKIFTDCDNSALRCKSKNEINNDDTRNNILIIEKKITGNVFIFDTPFVIVKKIYGNLILPKIRDNTSGSGIEFHITNSTEFDLIIETYVGDLFYEDGENWYSLPPKMSLKIISLPSNEWFNLNG